MWSKPHQCDPILEVLLEGVTCSGGLATLVEPKSEFMGPSLPPVGESLLEDRAYLGESRVRAGGRQIPHIA